MTSVELPTGIKQGAASTLMRSKAAAAYRVGDERTGRPIQPVMFLACATCVGLDVLTSDAATE